MASTTKRAVKVSGYRMGSQNHRQWIIEWQLEGGAVQRTERRFREFEALHQSLVKVTLLLERRLYLRGKSSMLFDPSVLISIAVVLESHCRKGHTPRSCQSCRCGRPVAF